MPELPEVETVRQGLIEWTVGRSILDVEVRNLRAIRRHAPGARDFADQLRGQEIKSVSRRGKYLWFGLTDFPLIAHLGMSGQFRVFPASEQPELNHPHARVIFRLTDGQLAFLDQRTFGGFHIDQWTQSGQSANDSLPSSLPLSLGHIARDPFDGEFDLGAAVVRIRQKRSQIKRVLLNQSVVSGIGNIYADEALFLAGIHPRRMASALSAKAVGELLGAVTRVMSAALAQGGTSFDALYVNVNGESGYFNRDLQVYGRAGQPCVNCGRLIKREEFMNRKSSFCPKCQPAPSGIASGIASGIVSGILVGGEARSPKR